MFHPADYNEDGRVSAADYTVWRNTVGSIIDFRADGTGPGGVPDGIIDVLDYQFWKMHYGTVGPGAGSGSGAEVAGLTVPEPQTAYILVMGSAFALLRRARSCPSAGRRAEKVHKLPPSARRIGGLPAPAMPSALPKVLSFAEILKGTASIMKKRTLDVETA
jgi:hypothetical protein